MQFCCLTDGQVVERLRRNPSNHFAGHECARLPTPREFLGNAHHEPAIHHDAKLGSDREHTFCCTSPKGTRISRCAADTTSNPSEFADFFLRSARQNRIAVEVHEQHRAPAPHQAIRGDGRVDAARHQTRHASAGPCRKSAGAGLLAKSRTRDSAACDMHRQRRIAEIDAPSGASLIRPPISYRSAARSADTACRCDAVTRKDEGWRPFKSRRIVSAIASRSSGALPAYE